MEPDFYKRRLLINALQKNPVALENIDQINNRPLSLNSKNPYTPENPLASQNGLNLGYGSLDLTRDRISMQKNGRLGDGYFHAEAGKNFTSDPYASMQYILPQRNGYIGAEGSITPTGRSFNINYKKNF